MENRTINIAVVAEVAQALRELKNQMVFIGVRWSVCMLTIRQPTKYVQPATST